MSRTDGGGEPSVGETPAGVVVQEDQSRSERYREYAETYAVEPFRVLWTDWRARTGFLIVAGFLLLGTVGVALVPSPETGVGPRYVAPFTSLRYPLGTDAFGKGVFSQLVHATPAMLLMIFSGAFFGVVVGTAVGVTAGYKGGLVDGVLMWATDVAMTLPGLPLVIVLSAVFEPRNPIAVGIVLTINDWAGLSRTVRSQVLTIREKPYVQASRTMGIPTPKILAGDIVPNIMPYVTVNFVGMARSVIFSSVGLYFLGILPFSTLNWGVMMNLAYNTGGALYTLETAHWLFFPMFAIIGLSLGLILLAQGADRIFNPRLRARGDAEADTEQGESTNPVPTQP